MKKALLVIDVQNEYFTGALKIVYPENSLDNIIRIMDYAEKNSIKIILVQHTGGNGRTFVKESKNWKIHSEIEKKHYDYKIEKTMPSSFHNTNLEEILKREKIENIIITGYMAQMCCDTTAREAFHKGYKVEFISDATGTIDVGNKVQGISAKELHKSTLITQGMRFSNVITTEKLISIDS